VRGEDRVMMEERGLQKEGSIVYIYRR